MIRYLMTKPQEKGLMEILTPQKKSWIHLEAPTDEEITQIVLLTGLPEPFLRAALDEDESPHIDEEDDAKLVVLDVPIMTDYEDSETILTMPMAVSYNKDYIVSVCIKSTTVINDFFNGKIKHLDTHRQSKVVYQLFYKSAVRFLHYLRKIDKISESIGRTLSKSMKNKELLQLVGLQKSLVFFTSSLTSNFSVVQRLAGLNMSKAPEDERDILEDVIIETKQAIDMCAVYREIIKNTMDAFAAVVNNNQNFVMKFLTAITIVLSIPMVISGWWGMNTGVPLEGEFWGFWVAVAISIIISIIVAIFMGRKRMF